MADAQWIIDYEARTEEVTDAKAANLNLTEPKLYPISGTTGKELPPVEAWYKLRPER